MSSKKLFRIILLVSVCLSVAFVMLSGRFHGEKLPVIIVYTLFLIPAGYGVAWALRALNWVAFSGSDGDGLKLIPIILKILSLPFLPFIALGRFIFRKRRESSERAREARERPERERQALVAANAEAERLKIEREAAYWASPAGQEVRAAERLAQIELEKSVALANLAMREQDAAMETARILRQEEEERERRRVELIKSI